MYDGGLQDPELVEYHKEIKFSVNLFLQDILEGDFADFFLTSVVGDYVYVYPLFYTDSISTDGEDCVVTSPYRIIVPVDYDGLITFFGDDGQVVESKRVSVVEVDGYVTVMVYNAKTKEFIPNHPFTVEYPNFPVEELSTGANGYGGFVKLESGYNVVIV
jgi:hypothetical protein